MGRAIFQRWTFQPVTRIALIAGLTCFVGAIGRAELEEELPVPVPPMANVNLPPNDPVSLIPVEQVRQLVSNLTGKIDPQTRKATLSGSIPAACVDYLHLEGTGRADGSGIVPFGLLDIAGGQGLKCLQTNKDECSVTSGGAGNQACVTFASLAKDPQTSANFRTTIKIPAGDVSKMRVGMANRMTLLNDNSRKLEAVGTCDCDLPNSLQNSPEAQPAATLAPQLKTLGSIDDAIKKLDEKDKDDGDGEKKDSFLRHVPTEEEMAKQVEQDLAPYQQMIQQNAATAYQQQVASYMASNSMMNSSLLGQFSLPNYSMLGSQSAYLGSYPSLQLPTLGTSAVSSIAPTSVFNGFR